MLVGKEAAQLLRVGRAVAHGARAGQRQSASGAGRGQSARSRATTASAAVGSSSKPSSTISTALDLQLALHQRIVDQRLMVRQDDREIRPATRLAVQALDLTEQRRLRRRRAAR